MGSYFYAQSAAQLGLTRKFLHDIIPKSILKHIECDLTVRSRAQRSSEAKCFKNDQNFQSNLGYQTTVDA